VQFHKLLYEAQANAQAALRAIKRSISLREEIKGLTSWSRSNGIDSNETNWIVKRLMKYRKSLIWL
jgi:2-hydroxy-3-keto-5-methylthiopentenyl-1-phosphate phosphatase